ncbi:MAG: homoaconitate hydratase [Acidobacteria bacterium]|nr:MAG: homoaconitate hydratase [Acidobacteriota bacterium]
MTIDSKIWVSELNARSEIRAAFPRTPVQFYDTTLRDGEQTVGVVLSPQQKLEIARKLDELGISRIEAGFPRVSPEDAEAIQVMQKADLKAELWGFSRAVKADIEELVRLGLRASIIEAPTSDIKLKAYGMSRDEVLRRISDSVSFARKNAIAVAFFAVDGTRTELDFLKKVCLAALDAGGRELVVVDTIGACGPEAAEFLVREVCNWAGPRTPVHWHGHNDFGMATACAVAAVRGGASWIQGTINGMGERAGNADIGEIALALRCLYDVPVALDLGKVRETSAVVSKASGYKLEAWKPLTGENLFMRESGAVASQFHIPEAIEPYSSELVNARRSIVLGKKSGLDSIDLKCKELGLSIAPEQRATILAEVKKLAIAKRGLVGDDEFRQIVTAQRAAAS